MSPIAILYKFYIIICDVINKMNLIDVFFLSGNGFFYKPFYTYVNLKT